MRPLGFSTGALARSDFRLGLELQRTIDRVRAVELSALRDHELEPLVSAIGELDLRRFEHVSVHAPSKLRTLTEERAFELLAALPETWPIIVHPEILQTPSLWQSLGSRLCIENMDNRKSRGRTASELRGLFDEYPEASFCLDVGHARQIDPTMAVALTMLYEFGDRLCQLHVSDVGPAGEHRPVRQLASWAYKSIARYVAETCPLIIESVVDPAAIEREVDAVAQAFDVEATARPPRRTSAAAATSS